MLARCYSGAVSGVEAQPVEIEVNSVVATSSFAIVGLPDQAVREAKDRVSTALKNSGFKAKEEFAVTVNLAPADVKKEGPIYDLPIAVALLKATQRLRTERLSEYAMIGELALSGEVRRVTRACSATTVCAAAYSASTPSCGVETCAALPWIFTLKQSTDALFGPAVTPIVPSFRSGAE